MLFLGVDGGQSSTTALIGDQWGNILGKGRGGPCNHASGEEGRAKLTGAVTESVGAALTAAGLPLKTYFRAACFGMSGGPADKRAILQSILPTDQLFVTDDAVIALTGALAGEPGMITIAGTGSIALGRNAEGKTMRAGGWGYVFGDEGGAFDIARKALRAAVRFEEGWGLETALTGLFLRETGCRDMNSVLHAFYTPKWPRSRVAQLAKSIAGLAENGDFQARQILEQAATQLAGYTLAIRQKLWEKEEIVKTAFVGGMFESSMFLEYYKRAVEPQRCQVVSPALSPAGGALLEAWKVAGIQIELSKLLLLNF
jgi:N-acetylglucosamine kinase-like BadF-type ATPase